MKIFGILLTLSLCIGNVNAQELLRATVSSAGSSQTISDGDLEFFIQQSIGQQSVIGSYSSDELTLRQGFIQPPVRIKSIAQDPGGINAVIYPNPFDSVVHVRFNEVLDNEISILIYDMQGRVVFENVMPPENEISIPLDFLSTAEYVLLLSSGEKNFKANILKN